jgi:DNA repair exonuclease SbcCD ATPase subunit
LVDRYNLISLRVHNFMGIEQSEIKFTDHDKNLRKVMTITGHQGGGKSTIIFAIQWCAYGTSIGATSRRLSRTRLYPGRWGGKQIEDISVTLRLRPVGNYGPETDIFCKRVLHKDSELDSLQVTIGPDNFDEIESKNYFRQIFGKPPQIEQGAMWVIRKEEMQRMAETITKTKSSYFLDFMNLDVPLNVLSDLKSDNEKTVERIGRKNWPSTHQLPFLEATRNSLRETIRQDQENEKKLTAWINENKPQKTQKDLQEAKETFDNANQKFVNAEKSLSKNRLRRDELVDLVNVLLSTKLESSGIAIEPSFNSTYDWEDIGSYLEKTRLFTPDVTNSIKELAQSSGYDTSGLLNRKESRKEWIVKIGELRQSLKNQIDSTNELRQLELIGLTQENLQEISRNNLEFDNKSNQLSELSEKIKSNEKKLEGIESEIKKIRKANTNESKDKMKLDQAERQNNLLNGLMDSIEEANHQYKIDLLSQTIERVKHFWDIIDQRKEYAPILIQEPTPQFALQNLTDSSVRYVQLDSSTGTASGGESQLLLICTCLAVSESSGAKMPIILDDCFTDVDEPTVKKLLSTVSEHFDSLIFVTNYEAKAKLIQNNDGVLRISRDHVDTYVNAKNSENWARWE